MDERALSFGRASDAYDRARPTYPAEAVAWLADGATDVVDVGAGTGKLTRGLLAPGRRVTAVEPDAAMLAVLARGLPGVRALAGSAEDLPLPDASADLITFGQAWHWVDVDAASAECARVLRPGGVLGLLWNVPDLTTDWVAQLDQIARSSVAEQTVRNDDVRVGVPFGALEERTFPWTRSLSPDALLELVASRSQLILSPAEVREDVLARVAALVAEHPDTAGRHELALPYITHAFRAVVSRAA